MTVCCRKWENKQIWDFFYGVKNNNKDAMLAYVSGSDLYKNA